MDMRTLNDLYRHMEWADGVVWKCLLKTESCRTDSKLKDYLYHLHLAQWAFLKSWQGQPLDGDYPTFEDLPSLMQFARSYYGEIFEYLRTLADSDLTQPKPMPWAGRVAKRLGRAPAVTTLGETILQVALHSTYHRGQVNARIRQAGGEPSLVDFLAWVWLGRPAPEWPE